MTELPDPKTEPTIGVIRAAGLLGISESAAYEAVHRHEIPCIKVGHRYRIPTAAFLDVLQVPDGAPKSIAAEPNGGPRLATLLGFVAVEAVKAGYFDDILPLIMGAAKVRKTEIG